MPQFYGEAAGAFTREISQVCRRATLEVPAHREITPVWSRGVVVVCGVLVPGSPRGQPSDGRRGAVLSRTGGRGAGSDGAQAKKKAPLSPHSAQTACRDCPGNSAVQRREGCGDGSRAARGDRERRKTRTQLVASSCPDPGSESQWAPPPPGAGSKFRHLHPWFRGPDPETAERVTEFSGGSAPSRCRK